MYEIVIYFRIRKRQHDALTFEESERRALLHKDWSRYKRRQGISEIQQISKALAAQQKALDALREESAELYQQAIQVSLVILFYVRSLPFCHFCLQLFHNPSHCNLT